MTDRYEWVAAQKADGYEVRMACEIVGVSRLAFYDWRVATGDAPILADLVEVELVAQIKQIHAESDGTYGEPRISLELVDRGWVVNHKRVARLMGAHGIVGVTEPRKCTTTVRSESNPKVPDLVKRR